VEEVEVNELLDLERLGRHILDHLIRIGQGERERELRTPQASEPIDAQRRTVSGEPAGRGGRRRRPAR
jgi:hypothetical protein